MKFMNLQIKTSYKYDQAVKKYNHFENLWMMMKTPAAASIKKREQNIIFLLKIDFWISFIVSDA